MARHWPLLVLALGIALVHTAIADDDAVPMLIGKLQNSESFRVRTQAAAVLGGLRDDRAIDPLIETLRNDSSYAVRGASAMALGNIGGVRAVGPLFQALDDGDPLVRTTSADALAKIQGRNIEDAFRAHFLDGSPKEQKIAFARLNELAAAGVAPAATAMLQGVHLADYREIIIQSLQRLPAAVAIPALLPALDDEDSSIRIVAAQLLGQHPEPQVIEALATVYDRTGEEENVREAVRKSIFAMRARVDVPARIQECQVNEDRDSRARAIRLLGIIGGPRVLATLETLLDEEDNFIRGKAVLALADADAKSSLPRLMQLRQDPKAERIYNILDTAIGRLKR